MSHRSPPGSCRAVRPGSADPSRSSTTPTCDAPKPGPGEQLEPAPHPLLDLRPKFPGCCGCVAGAPDVLVVHEELGGVAPSSTPGRRRPRTGRARCGSGPPVRRTPSATYLGHPPLVQPGQRLDDDTAGAERIVLPDPQMGGQVVGRPIPRHRVGASGPTLSNRSHRSARSDLANVTRRTSSARLGRAPRGTIGPVDTTQRRPEDETPLDPDIAALLKRDPARPGRRRGPAARAPARC